ncbi:MAG: AraC family transcriptional regulator [Lachnospiraceae bacterium]|jgi:AraC family transcriptional regulator of arabinose operon
MENSIQKKELRVSDGFRHEQMFVLNPQAADAFRKLTGGSGLYLTDAGYYPKAAGHYRARPSGTQTAILLYARKGSGTVQLKDRTIRLRENEAFVIPAGEPHIYYADDADSWSLFWVHAGGRALEEFSGAEDKRKLSGERAAQRMELYFEMMFQALSEGLTERNFRYLDRLLQTIFAEVFWREESGGTEKGSRTVSGVIRYFYRNLGRSVTMDDLTQEAGLSAGYISALFRKYTGSSPLAYFTRLKMEKACYLLRTSTMNVSELARELGYSDPYYFSRVFKRTVGVPPGKYRRA